MFLIYMRRVLAGFFPGSLVDLIQPGNPPGVVDGPRDDAPDAKVETRCMS